MVIAFLLRSKGLFSLVRKVNTLLIVAINDVMDLMLFLRLSSRKRSNMDRQELTVTALS